MCRWMGWLGQEVLIDELLFKEARELHAMETPAVQTAG